MEGGSGKKAFLREEDVFLLSNKYPIMTILSLLREISHHASSPKLDWDALVKNTCTGISNPREYQMLWRHLAYGMPLSEKLEIGTETLDDDSDLELELEAFPALSEEASVEAAAAVKVLMSAGSVHEHVPNRSTSETPLQANASNGQVPAVNKQVAGSSGDAVEGNGGPGKKKRKLWTKEEDLELIAAVDKCGEGNWANILKGDFKHDRTASQLSQRWSIIRKRRASLNSGSGPHQHGSSSTESHMAATWQAVNMAIKMPITGSLASRRPSSSAVPPSTDPPSTSSTPSPAPAPEPTTETPPSQPAAPSTFQKVNPPTKSKVNPKAPAPAPLGKPSTGPASIIQAAAIAAGGRIAPPSTAASHFKAAQSKNAVHIRPCGSLQPKSTPLTLTSRGSKSTEPKHLTQNVDDGMDGVVVKRESEGDVDFPDAEKLVEGEVEREKSKERESEELMVKSEMEVSNGQENDEREMIEHGCDGEKPVAKSETTSDQ